MPVNKWTQEEPQMPRASRTARMPATVQPTPLLPPAAGTQPIILLFPLFLDSVHPSASLYTRTYLFGVLSSRFPFLLCLTKSKLQRNANASCPECDSD